MRAIIIFMLMAGACQAQVLDPNPLPRMRGEPENYTIARPQRSHRNFTPIPMAPSDVQNVDGHVPRDYHGEHEAARGPITPRAQGEVTEEDKLRRRVIYAPPQPPPGELPPRPPGVNMPPRPVLQR
jgi:hypothetical protein